MSANDYLTKVEKMNPKLFTASEIKISIPNLKVLIKHAFESGEEAGRNSKSLFETVFGKDRFR